MPGELILPELKTEGAQLIVEKQDVIGAVMAGHLDFQRFLATALIEANEHKDCWQPSVVKAALNCAVVGLLPGGALGHAYFVPFKNKKENYRKEVQLVVGYKGYLDLAFRSGFVVAAHAEVVYQSELADFEVWNDEAGQHVRHNLTRRFKGETVEEEKDPRQYLRGAYCTYTTRGSGHGIVGMSRNELNEVDTHKNVWKSNYAAMCRKSPVRRAKNEWQLTVQLAQADLLDEYEQRGEAQPNLAEAESEQDEAAVSLADYPAVPDEGETDGELPGEDPQGR